MPGHVPAAPPPLNPSVDLSQNRPSVVPVYSEGCLRSSWRRGETVPRAVAPPPKARWGYLRAKKRSGRWGCRPLWAWGDGGYNVGRSQCDANLCRACDGGWFFQSRLTSYHVGIVPAGSDWVDRPPVSFRGVQKYCPEAARLSKRVRRNLSPIRRAKNALTAPEGARQGFSVVFSAGSLSLHHQSGGSSFCSGQSWLSVSPSNSSPFFMT